MVIWNVHTSDLTFSYNYMQKALLTIIIVCAAVTNLAQTAFSLEVPPEDNKFRDGMFVVEMPGEGFVVSCQPPYIYENNMLITLSLNGEITNRLIMQLEGKNLEYCDLFRHPQNVGEFVGLAILTESISANEFVQNSMAFIRFDKDLDVIDYNVWHLGDDFLMLESANRDLPKFVVNDNGTITMAAHCLKNDGYCYLFANFTLDGDILSVTENHGEAMDGFTDIILDFMTGNGGYRIVKWSNDNHGGDFLHCMDNNFNVNDAQRISGTVVRLAGNPSLPDTTFSYMAYGKGCCFNDTTFFLTSYGSYLDHIKGQFGYNNFIALTNDSLQIIDVVTWDCAPKTDSNKAWPAKFKAICVTNDAVYHCGIIGVGAQNHYSMPYFAPTRIVVSKFDKELHLVWRRYLARDNDFFDINTISATDDGGCILAGVSSYSKSYNYIYTFICKLDADGYDTVDENIQNNVKPFLCYPNPAQDIVYIEFSPDVNCQSVEIYDLDGKLIKSQNFNCETIDISNLNSGVYLLKMRMADGKEFSERIVKE